MEKTMDIRKYAKEDIAAHLIETALDLFFLEADLFSIVTLAGVAEEMLKELLQARKEDSGFPALIGSLLDILRPSHRKELKDERPVSHETDAFVHTDVYREARFLLCRAIDDYLELTGILSENMQRFNESVRLRS